MPSRPLKSLYHFSKLENQLRVLKTEEALAPQLFMRFTQKCAWYIFVIRASDAALPTFDTIRKFSPTRGLSSKDGGPLFEDDTYPVIYKKSEEPRH